jgi:predicted enzyme related to lactoylglutathione lyase
MIVRPEEHCMPKIRHIAIYTSDPDKMAKFYCECFGMTIRQDYAEVPGTGRAIFISDGYMEVALIHKKDGQTGINHFGFSLESDEKDDIYRKIREHGVEPRTANPDRPYVEDFMIDVEGNKVDLSTKGLSLERQHIKETLGHA